MDKGDGMKRTFVWCIGKGIVLAVCAVGSVLVDSSIAGVKPSNMTYHELSDAITKGLVIGLAVILLGALGTYLAKRQKSS